MKICKQCKISKELEEFHTDKRTKDGFYPLCKFCKRNYDKVYRKSEKIISIYKSEEYRERKTSYQAAKFNADPRKVLYKTALTRARQKQIPFNITLEDIIIPNKCSILEIDLLKTPYGERRGFHMNSPSLDRIIPELGYIKGNVQVISMKANAMKYCATITELELFCTNILKLISNVRNTSNQIMDNRTDN